MYSLCKLGENYFAVYLKKIRKHLWRILKDTKLMYFHNKKIKRRTNYLFLWNVYPFIHGISAGIIFCPVLSCPVLFCFLLLSSSLLYYFLFYSILFYSILFYSILSVSFYFMLFHSNLFYTILFYSILFYSILFYSILKAPFPERGFSVCGN